MGAVDRRGGGRRGVDRRGDGDRWLRLRPVIRRAAVSAVVALAFSSASVGPAAAVPDAPALRDPITLSRLTVDAHIDSPSGAPQSSGSVSIDAWGRQTQPLEVAVKPGDALLLHISLSVTRAGVFFQGCAQTLDLPGTGVIYNGTDLTFTQSFATKIGWANLESDWSWTGRKAGSLTFNCFALGTVTMPIGITVTASASDSELTGFTINRGMYATNSTDVLLNLSWRDQDYFDQVMLSNDGGFAAAKRGVMPLTSDIVRWRLDAEMPERMARTVYVRFHNVLTDEWTPAVTDDIVLDTVSPVVDDAIVSDATPRSVRSDTRFSCVIRIAATDNRTGVVRVQVAPSKRSDTKVSVRFSQRVVVPFAAESAKFVRVQDGAGNWSQWRRTVTVSR